MTASYLFIFLLINWAPPTKKRIMMEHGLDGLALFLSGLAIKYFEKDPPGMRRLS